MYNPNRKEYDSTAEILTQKSYMICSIPRSGSTLVCNALYETQLAGVPHEYFHCRHMKTLGKRWGTGDFLEFVDTLKTKRTSPNGVFAFKVHFYQYLDQLANQNLNLLFPNLNYIFVTRNDHIRQAISFARARQTKRWVYEDCQETEAVFDRNLIDECLQWIESEEEQWEEYFLKKKIMPYRVVYEHFIESYEDIVRDILKCFDIDRPKGFTVKPPWIRKQADHVTEEWLIKYKSDVHIQNCNTNRIERDESNAINDESNENHSSHAKKNHIEERELPCVDTDKITSGDCPRISVGILSYNFEEYLSKCIESILAQTLQPYEIIICDDHSTDRSWSIIREYSQRYPDLIKAFRHDQNIGMVRNSNFVLGKCKGNLISVLDGDDRWLPRKLEVEWKTLKLNPDAQIAYSNVYAIDEQGSRTGIWYNGTGPVPPSGDVFVRVFSKRFFPFNRSILRNQLMFRSILDGIDWCDETIPVHIDWDLKIRLTSRHHVIYSHEALVEYRVHNKGIHRSPPQIMYKSILAVYEKNLPLLDHRTEKEAQQVKDEIQTLLKSFYDKTSEDREKYHAELDIQKAQSTCTTPRFLVNSLPKAGTNLLGKVVALFPGIEDHGIHIGRSALDSFENVQRDMEEKVPIGVDFPQLVSLDAIRNALSGIDKGHFITAHIPFSEKLAHLLIDMRIRMLLIIRDPRDVAISHARYIANQQEHPLQDYYKKLTESERIMHSIIGDGDSPSDRPRLLNIAKRCESLVLWSSQPFTYTTYFEKLVGPQGGGTRREQTREIKNIAKHLNVVLNGDDTEKIAEQVFGGTATFHKGKIGGWQHYFTEEHRRVFHQIAGQLLVDLGYEENDNWLDKYGNNCSPLRRKDVKSRKRKKRQMMNSQGENLIFLISQPRSGSTLLQRILGSHPDIFTLAEPWIMLHPVYSLKKSGKTAEYDALLAQQGLEDFLSAVPEGDQMYIEALRKMGIILYNRVLELSGKTFFLDKTPRYYFIIEELYRIFPQAKFVFLLRNPVAVLSSIFKTWLGNQPEALINSPLYTDVMEGPRYIVDGIKILKEGAIVVHYEKLVTHPDSVISDLCKRIGVSFVKDMLEYGQKPPPQGRFGDQIGINRHSKPVTNYIDAWMSNLSSPEMSNYARHYLSKIGPDIVSQMGYSYEEIIAKIDLQKSINAEESPADQSKKIRILNQEGETSFAEGNLDKALSAFTQALEVDPRCAEAHNNLGVVYSAKGGNKEAQKHYDEALRLEPHNTTYQKNLADFYYVVLGQREDAIRMYLKVLDSKPDDVETLTALGQLCITGGLYDSARKYFARALDEDPQNTNIRRIVEDLKQHEQGQIASESEPPHAEPESKCHNAYHPGRYLISAIVSTYNSEHFIRGCLESLENQTIADKIEIIVVNSGSQQKEENIVKEFQKTYSNIKYIKTNKRETVYQAWNRAIKVASGKYLTNANTDDRLRDDTLEKLTNLLEENPDKVLAYGDSMITKRENETFHNCTPEGYLRWPDFDRRKLLEFCCIGPHPLWRRQVHGEVGLFDEQYQCSGDYEFWLRIALKYEFVHIPELVGLYWLNEGTLSRKGDLPLVETARIQQAYGGRYRNLLVNASSQAQQRIKKENRKGKILYVVHEFPPYHVGGTGVYTFSLSKEMQKRGYEVWVAYPVYSHAAEYRYYESSYDGIGIVEFYVPQNRDLFLMVKDKDLGDCFEEYLKINNFDIVHFQHFIGLAGNLLETANNLNIYTVVTLHDFWFMCHAIHLMQDGEQLCSGPESIDKCVTCLINTVLSHDPAYKVSEVKEKLYEFVDFRYSYLKSAIQIPDTIFCPSLYVKGMFDKYGLNNGKIVLNSLGIHHFTPQPKQNQTQGIIRFGFLGNNAKIKGLGYLLDAFEKINGNTELSIRGRIPEKSVIEKIHNSRNAHYKGSYVQEDLPRIFSELDIVIVPSLNESFSLVIREAFHSGTPIMASRAGAIPEIVKDGKNGILFNPGNIKELTEKIEYIVSNPEKILDFTRHIQEVKTIRSEAEEIEETYRRAIEENRRRSDNTAQSFQIESGTQRGIVSIVILTFNQLKYTKKCVFSIRKHTPEPHEIVFVDNGSTDGTIRWLKQLVGNNENYKLIENITNLGFSKGCNQGITASSGEYILLLNNDVVVTEGWLSGMLEHMESSSDVGIVGPMTNEISGPQKVSKIGYKSLDHLNEYTKAFRKEHRNRSVPSRRIVGFCMLFRRELVERIGLLDEDFGSGNYEDDDYCLRAAMHGYRNIIAGDVFIHHFGSRSFIGNRIDFNSAMARNRKIFAEKWSTVDANSPAGKKLLIVNALEKADELHQKGEMDRAVEMLLGAIKVSPYDRRSYLMLAEILIDSKQFKDALNILNKIPEDLKDLKRLELTGYCSEGLELYEKAKECADLVLSMNGDSASALNLKGILAYKRGDKDTADHFFSKAIGADPKYGEAYTNRGVLKWSTEDREEGLNLMDRGFILAPTLTDIVTIYHSASSESRTFERAENAFREAKDLHPFNRRITFLLIDILIQQGKHDRAMKEIEQTMAFFGIDDGILSAALSIRDKVGHLEIDKESHRRSTLSLCMIAKNEEEHIAKCLMSVQAVVDEIILVDTGSTDRTRDIARAFGAKVYELPWKEDFSQARNYSLSKASGDWIFVLDADEVISPSDHARLLQIVKKRVSKPVAFSITTRNYVTAVHLKGWTANDGQYSSEEAGTGWFPSEKVRLFRNDSHIQFENPVHELVEPSLERAGIKMKKCSVSVHHYGRLNSKKTSSKGEEYYLIGKRKLDENGGTLETICELAVQAGELEKYDDAVELWSRVIEEKPDYSKAYLNMGHAYLELGKYRDALSASRKAVELDPESREAVYNYAFSELFAGDVMRTISVLEDLIRKEPEYPSADIMLATAYCCNGLRDQSLELFTKFQQMDFGFADVVAEFAEKLMTAGRREYALSLLNAAIESKNVNENILALHVKCSTMTAIGEHRICS